MHCQRLPSLFHFPMPLLAFPGFASQINHWHFSSRLGLCFWETPIWETPTLDRSIPKTERPGPIGHKHLHGSCLRVQRLFKPDGLSWFFMLLISLEDSDCQIRSCERKMLTQLNTALPTFLTISVLYLGTISAVNNGLSH